MIGFSSNKKKYLFVIFIFLMIPLGFFIKQWYCNTSFFPVEVVSVSGQVHQETKETIEAVVGELTEKGFFGVSLNEVQKAVGQSPWVKTCRIKRVWPGRFEITVLEKTPIARFGENGLVEGNGELFFPKSGKKDSYIAKLVLLNGPTTKTKVMLDRAMRMMEELSPLGLRLMEVNLENNGAWSIMLANGITVYLGSEAIDDRLIRFKLAYRGSLKDKVEQVKFVDLRYTNSVAVAWK